MTCAARPPTCSRRPRWKLSAGRCFARSYCPPWTPSAPNSGSRPRRAVYGPQRAVRVRACGTGLPLVSTCSPTPISCLPSAITRSLFSLPARCQVNSRRAFWPPPSSSRPLYLYISLPLDLYNATCCRGQGQRRVQRLGSRRAWPRRRACFSVRRFLRRSRVSYLADSILVLVDYSRFTGRARQVLFMNGAAPKDPELFFGPSPTGPKSSRGSREDLGGWGSRPCARRLCGGRPRPPGSFPAPRSGSASRPCAKLFQEVQHETRGVGG